LRYRILVIAACALAAGACCKRQACNSSVPAVSVTKLTERPAGYLGRTVTVNGLLRNAGGNYFTDLRLELSDGRAAVVVQPWLPLEVPPMRTGAGGNRPPVLSDYLGKKVKITGCLRKDGEIFLLEVQQAEIIAEENK
jgi:hypothetical protein